ncbi:hypothetical protein TNCV_1010501 [Trichonephila clavipes]|nr:hypothetical protein TNCV_1010501 [Trichonephila clavipes]
MDLLKDTFGNRLISRFGPVNWPPRSCDLTPLDYFLWGYVKSLVYADKPQTLDHFEDNIRRVIADTRPQMLEKVIENWTSRLDYIRASRGSPMPEIIFKIQSIIHKEFLPEGTTMNAARYTEILTRFMKRLRMVQPQCAQGSWFFAHGNACPHTANIFKQFRAEKVVVQSEYSPFLLHINPPDLFQF